MVGIESIKKAIRDLIQGNELRSSISDSEGNIVSDIPFSVMASRTRIYEQSFEDGTTDTYADNAIQTVQSSEYYTGSYSLRVTVAPGQTGYIETPYKPISAGQKVGFSFAHKEDSNIESIEFVAVWYRSNGKELATEAFSITLSSDWDLYSKELTAPANAAYVSLRIRATAVSGEVSGNFYVDDINIDIYGQILKLEREGVKVTDTHLLSGLQPARSGTEQVLNSEAISAGGTSEFVVDNTDGYSAIVLTVKATYNASATQGVRVRWLYSPNGSDYDSEEDAENGSQYVDLTFAAGEMRVRTILVPIFQPYVKVQVINKDSSYSVTVDVWKTLLR